MPRTARLSIPFTFRHVTARVLNGEHRLDSSAARDEYLKRLAQVVRRYDVRWLSFALMSNHVHLGFEVLEGSVSRVMQSLQGAFAGWLNDRQGRSGYLWGGRYHEVVGDDAAFAAHVITYHHNNPVRAGVVDAAADSTWTSHAAYLGRVPRFPELDVARGLELCGCRDTPAGRAEFDELTLSRVAIGRCDWMSEEWVDRVRRRTREVAESPVEVGQPRVPVMPSQTEVARSSPAEVPLVVADLTAAGFRLAPHVDVLVRVASEHLGFGEWSLRGRNGSRNVQLARRAMAWAWARRLGGRTVDLARALNRSKGAVSHWLHRLDTDPRDERARRLGDELATLLQAGYVGSGS